MKKLSLIIFLSLISLNSYAFEQVIGVGAGYGISLPSASHYQVNLYNGSDNNPNNDKIITWTQEKKYINSSYSFDIEYQARLGYITENFLTVGIGYRNELTSINTNYNIIDKSIITHNPYVLGLFTFYQGKDLSLD